MAGELPDATIILLLGHIAISKGKSLIVFGCERLADIDRKFLDRGQLMSGLSGN